MKQKAEIIKTVDINEDYAILIVKKIKAEPKKCVNCEYMTSYDPIKRVGYCSKHHGIVSMEDTCIEEGM